MLLDKEEFYIGVGSAEELLKMDVERIVLCSVFAYIRQLLGAVVDSSTTEQLPKELMLSIINNFNEYVNAVHHAVPGGVLPDDYLGEKSVVDALRGNVEPMIDLTDGTQVAFCVACVAILDSTKCMISGSDFGVLSDDYMLKLIALASKFGNIGTFDDENNPDVKRGKEIAIIHASFVRAFYNAYKEFEQKRDSGTSMEELEKEVNESSKKKHKDLH